ncbi:uncharacterized protein EV154DRAFT_550581 [Mucor mucedo]|uniref:uncharacterized protein n=1 Tax=Mucor mucedo TaxID=29922 RepID=UPI002220F77B|nr:uncharacterized protein EV154DRAFT_550581 [Mucor mucedo]KAI7892644.1 hypothetical protein EV154DRAFT_550581 [Mucor mucedo]
MTVVLGQESNSFTMEPLYEGLLQQKFMSSTEAIEFCRQSCQEYGFTIKQEAGANKNIYIYCSREGLGQQAQRKRPLKNCECKWRVVLSEDEYSQWTFRKSLNPTACEHNHSIVQWPQDMVDKIIQLARKNSTDDEIRAAIKSQFPNVSWDDRLFYNHLNEERKRMKQKEVTDRVQKLVMASTKLCSVVAANEDWASSVESDLTKMLDVYREMTKLTNQSLDSMVDLQLDMIHSEIDKRNKRGELKKRKITAVQGVQVMSIPSCTLYIRSQPLRSLSETRQSFDSPPPQLLNPFNLTSPSSSPSSTSSIHQRIDYAYTTNRNNEILQSPPMPDNTSMIITPNFNNNNPNNYLAPYTTTIIRVNPLPIQVVLYSNASCCSRNMNSNDICSSLLPCPLSGPLLPQ